MSEFTVNGRSVSTDAPDDTPLLWVLRDELGLTGTKFGCGIAQCGACTVHFNGAPIRSCVTPVVVADGGEIVTIEGLGSEDGPHPLQRAWVDEQVPQCGYCQSGQIMQAAALLSDNPDPSDEDIVAHMNGNLCRCMAYVRINRAIRAAARMVSEES
ncbi:MAG: (2Fe-2S)-binding protein [Caulobacterales bacterium]|nr:(2Fe-2S)-binding protein [Caulobacterales bacterium]